LDDDNKKEMLEMGWEGVELTHLVQRAETLPAFLNTLVNQRILSSA
jgi:hypothetical protein